MTTFANLVDDVMLLMTGYGLEQDRAAFLSAALPASALAAPVVNAPTTAATGGTLDANTYYYVVTALTGGGGETTISNRVSQATTGATSTVTLTWGAVSGATGYKVYRATTSGSEALLATLGAVTTYTDTGSATTATVPPTSNTTAVTVAVDSTADLSTGVAEIGDELVYIKTIDSATQFTIAPDGRGYRGTVAATHAVNARVTMSPVLPRGLVKRKINETITGVYPTLYGTASTTLTWDPVKATYAVPADVEDIIQVTYDELGPSGQWPRVQRWRLDTHPDTTEWPTGKTLSIWDSLWGVTSIRVVYQKQPTELSLDADLLTASGLKTTARSAIVTGAAWRLVSFMDASRLKAHTPSTDLMDESAPIGSAVQVASLLRRQYERELEEERQRQSLRNVPVLHWQE